MRHAKSDWGADFSTDRERPLNQRGVRSARLIGRLLTARGEEPDHLISSPAVRARTTAELARVAGSWECPLEVESSLYEGGVSGTIQVVAGAPEVQSLMIVGHQPTWSLLVRHLTGDEAEIKTASVAHVALELDRWAEVEGGAGRLVSVLNPRDYFGSGWDLAG